LCNLNIFLRADKLDETKLMRWLGFMTAVTSNSYLSNDDGEGFYLSNGTIVKSEHKINPLLLHKEINNSRVVITHQRIATSGRTKEYLHPFEVGEFVIAHNGILSSFVMNANNHSDTYNMAHKFLEVYNASLNPNRSGKIRETIKSIFDNIVGSFSIVIYDKVTKRTYYFKNQSTSIYFHLAKDRSALYITTKKDNENLLTLLDDEFNEANVEDYRIYEIWAEDGVIKSQKIGKIAKYEYNYSGYSKTKTVKRYGGFNDIEQDVWDEGKYFNDLPSYMGRNDKPIDRTNKVSEELKQMFEKSGECVIKVIPTGKCLEDKLKSDEMEELEQQYYEKVMNKYKAVGELIGLDVIDIHTEGAGACIQCSAKALLCDPNTDDCYCLNCFYTDAWNIINQILLARADWSSCNSIDKGNAIQTECDKKTDELFTKLLVILDNKVTQ